MATNGSNNNNNNNNNNNITNSETNNDANKNIFLEEKNRCISMSGVSIKFPQKLINSLTEF